MVQLLNILKTDNPIVKAAKELINTKREGKPVIIFTGAGISIASGVPSFSSATIFSEIEKPKLFFEMMLKSPLNYLREIVLFKRRLMAAKPNMGHYTIAWLIKKGYAQTIITGNLDGLHEKTLGLGEREPYTGTQKIFLELASGETLNKNIKLAKAIVEKAEVLIISGWSQDEHGIIEVAKRKGVLIIEISPDRRFASERYINLHGYSQILFPAIQKEIYMLDR